MSMKLYQIKAGSYVFKEGASPEHFFIIKSGSVDLIIN
jgi:CRP-like cAMP-binding protein